LVSDLSSCVKKEHTDKDNVEYQQFTVVLNRHNPKDGLKENDVGLGLTVLSVSGMIHVHALTRPQSEGDGVKGPAEISGIQVRAGAKRQQH